MSCGTLEVAVGLAAIRPLKPDARTHSSFVAQVAVGLAAIRPLKPELNPATTKPRCGVAVGLAAIRPLTLLDRRDAGPTVKGLLQ